MPDSSPAIQVNLLNKTYQVPEREAGCAPRLADCFTDAPVPCRPCGISPSRCRRARWWVPGPNGAGKTTTLKMLSGLLHPDQRRGQGAGHRPERREKTFLPPDRPGHGQPQSTAMGYSRPGLFELNRASTGFPSDFKRTRDEFIELLELGDLVEAGAESLARRTHEDGDRRRAPPPAAVLFLDEPTIGLDVTMQRRIRTFSPNTTSARRHRAADQPLHGGRRGALQSSDRDPPGRINFDGPLAGLVDRFAPTKRSASRWSDPSVDFERLRRAGGITATGVIVLRVPKAETSAITARSGRLPVTDLTVEEPLIEDVIERVFAPGTAGVKRVPRICTGPT